MKLSNFVLILCILAIFVETTAKKRKRKHHKHREDKSSESSSEEYSKPKQKKQDSLENSSQENSSERHSKKTESNENNEGNPNAKPDPDYDDDDAKPTKNLQKSFLAILNTLANTSSDSLINVSVAAEILLKDLSDEGMGVLQSFASIPEIAIMDAPTQFIECLKLLEQKFNESNGKLKSNDVIQVLVDWSKKTKEETTQSQLKLSNFITFWPSVLTGFNKFFKKSITEGFKSFVNK